MLSLKFHFMGSGRSRAKSRRIWTRGRQPVTRRRSLSLACCSHPCRQVPATVRSTGFRARDPATPLSRLFPLERVFDAADSVLNFSCRLVGLAL